MVRQLYYLYPLDTMTLALFDFDGTITNKDSLLHFTAFAKKKIAFYTGMLILSPVLILNKFRIVSSQKTKNKYLSYFFKNMSTAKFNEISAEYVLSKLDSIVIKDAVRQINWHKHSGHRVVVVSASPENYLLKWCSNYGIECIATKLQTSGGKITGKIEGLNCTGAEKEKRIKEKIDLQAYTDIYGYGNSRGDKEMLALCNKPHYKIYN